MQLVVLPFVHVRVQFSSCQGNLFWDRTGIDSITSGYGHSAVRIREEMFCLIYSYYSFICKNPHAHQNKHSLSFARLTLRQLSWRQKCYKRIPQRTGALHQALLKMPVSSLQISVKWGNYNVRNSSECN